MSQICKGCRVFCERWFEGGYCEDCALDVLLDEEDEVEPAKDREGV